MARVPIVMPQLGESIAEATVVRKIVAVGDAVSADQDLLEVETSKAVLTVTAPCSGRLTQLAVELGETYAVGSTLGYIESADSATVNSAAAASVPTSPAASVPAEALSPAPMKRPGVLPTVRGLPVPAHATGASYMSPRLKSRMDELGLHAADLAGLAGSGAGGRVTIDDLENFFQTLQELKLTPASSMRVAVADAMRRSWTRPLATVGLTCRLDAVLEHRKTVEPRPGPALYALRALAVALKHNSAVAGRLIGAHIVHPASTDVGFAVEAEDGVLVPVLRNADARRLKDLVKPYNDLVEQARARRLPAEATGRSIATVTNYGTFGLVWATPIPLPEQTLVLGLGAGRKVPFWDEAQNRFVPVVEANLTLSFDHRVLDGGAAGRLLAHVVALMQEPAAL